MVAKRLLFGSLLIAALLLLLWGDLVLSAAPQPALLGLDLSAGSLVPLAIAVLSALGALEALRLAAAAGHRPLVVPVVLGVLVFHGAAIVLPAMHHSSALPQARGMLIPLLFMTIACAQVARRRTAQSFGDMACSMFIVVYMGLLPSFITSMRTSAPGAAGAWAVLLFVAVVKFTDIGAYFTGLTLGRTKLIPAISPAKTVEGLAGGLALAAGVAVVLIHLLPLQPAGGAGSLTWMQAMGFGGTVGLLGQTGDLVESLLKRDAKAKDSGQLIPTFGGVLDLLDSPAFAAPVGFMLLRGWLS